MSSECAGESAASTVKELFLTLVSGEWHDLIAVEEDIDGFVHVAALDDYGVGTHLHDFSRGGFHVAGVLYGQAGKDFRLGNIWSNDAGAPEQFGSDEFDSGGIQQLRSGRRLHDWIGDDMSKLVGVQKFRHGDSVAAISEHADLHASDFAVADQDIELRTQSRAGGVLNFQDALRILNGQ